MLESLGGVTSDIVRLGLDMALLRHEVTAHNIANASTPGYVPKRVQFATELREMLAAVRSGADEVDLNSRVRELRDRLTDRSVIHGRPEQSVEVDMEMIELTENVLYYRALLEAQAKRGDILRSAIRERSTQ